MKFPEHLAVLPPPQPLLVLQSEVMGISRPGAGTLGCAVCPGAGIAHSQGIPADFYPPHMNVGPPMPILPPLPPLCAILPLFASLPVSASLPFLPV